MVTGVVGRRQIFRAHLSNPVKHLRAQSNIITPSQNKSHWEHSFVYSYLFFVCLFVCLSLPRGLHEINNSPQSVIHSVIIDTKGYPVDKNSSVINHIEDMIRWLKQSIFHIHIIYQYQCHKKKVEKKQLFVRLRSSCRSFCLENIREPPMSCCFLSNDNYESCRANNKLFFVNIVMS